MKSRKNTFTVQQAFQCRDADGKLTTATVKIEVRVDVLQSALYMGGKALQNKGKISHDAGGLLEVEAIGRLPDGYRLVHSY